MQRMLANHLTAVDCRNYQLAKRNERYEASLDPARDKKYDVLDQSIVIRPKCDPIFATKDNVKRTCKALSYSTMFSVTISQK